MVSRLDEVNASVAGYYSWELREQKTMDQRMFCTLSIWDVETDPLGDVFFQDIDKLAGELNPRGPATANDETQKPLALLL
jgi:hypothetical protein